MNLEDELRNALRREEPPEGFAERVLARAARTEAPALSWWRFPWMRPALVAACAVLLAVAGAGYRQWQGETAKQRALLALGIAGGQLHATQIRVRNMLDARAGAAGETGAQMENPQMENQ
jgi:hypothetical protein